MNENFTAYAVRLKSKPRGDYFLAHGRDIAPSMFSRRKDAVDYRNQLIEAGCKGGVVVKVDVTIRAHDQNVRALKV